MFSLVLVPVSFGFTQFVTNNHQYYSNFALRQSLVYVELKQ